MLDYRRPLRTLNYAKFKLSFDKMDKTDLPLVCSYAFVCLFVCFTIVIPLYKTESDDIRYTIPLQSTVTLRGY